jgi:FMN phosphatase YigB (HAD superfamily)
MPYVIFDLDGTVINSDHRKASLPDGSLDLAHWIENSTPEKIALDTLLPLARVMRILYAAGNTIVVCTARCIETPEIQEAFDDFFAENNLPFHEFLCREPGNNESDETLKVRLLKNYFKSEGFVSPAEANAIFFDDNLKVLDAVGKIGITCYDSTICNRRLAA